MRKRTFGVGPVAITVGVMAWIGCSSSPSNHTGGSGGTSGSGGISASGGASGSGGTSGSGGVSGSGGHVGSGGASATGGASGSGGLASATGGQLGSGGASASGGVSSAGGSASGGTTPSGGTTSTGGSSSGGISGNGGTSAAAPAAPPFDWVGVVGSGQSLSVGTTPASSTTQPYNNMMLSLNGVTVPGTGTDPWDSSSSALTMVPLIEPVRALETAYPSPYPGNIYGETPHATMANEMTRLVKAASASADYITVHTVVGESGQGVPALVKQTGSTTDTIGRAYAATLFEAGAITRLAKAAGKSYGVGVVVMTHGETDCNNATYGDSLVQLLSDYNTDIPAVTGQTYKIPMFLSQQHGCPGAPACTARPRSVPPPTTSSGSWVCSTRETSCARAPSINIPRTRMATAST